MADADDESQLEYAARENRTLVTADDDLLRLHAAWQESGKQHAGLFYILPEVRNQKKGATGIIVRALHFYYEATVSGAAVLEQDVYNQVRYIGVKEWT